MVHLRDDLTEQAVGTDDVRPVARHPVVDNEQVVADRIVTVDVTLRRDHRRGRRGPHLVVEDLVAQRLGGSDLRLRRCQPDIERASAVEVRRALEQMRRHRRCRSRRKSHGLRIPQAGPVPVSPKCDSVT